MKGFNVMTVYYEHGISITHNVMMILLSSNGYENIKEHNSVELQYNIGNQIFNKYNNDCCKFLLYIPKFTSQSG